MSDMEQRRPLTYEAAGVSVERGNQAVEWIKPLARSTRRPEVISDVGGFAGAFRVGDTDLLAGADGVGSKLLLAQALGRLETIGIDLVAMNVNDILAAGGEPLFFLDYIAMGRLVPERVRDLVQGIAEGCLDAGCALLGGETAEMPDLYHNDDFDLSGFAVGRRVFQPEVEPEPGDVLLGLASVGFHANGFQLIRTVVKESQRGLDDRPPELEGVSLGEALLRPTRIYVKPLMALWSEVPVRALAHITGGGLVENVPRTLGGRGAVIDPERWPWPAEMRLIQQWGHIDDAEMLRTFNCGIGFTVVVPERYAGEAEEILKRHQVDAYRIGQITQEPGVRTG